MGLIASPLVPGCDGAGVVLATGSSVNDLHPGDGVITYAVPRLAREHGDAAMPSIADAPHMLGQGVDGTLRTVGVFAETALVRAPRSVGWMGAATLSCTWLTGWNVLFGRGVTVGSGEWVLVQGTGGVSVAVLQLAVAVGARVVATTSGEEKAARLRGLGAAFTVDYRKNPAWGVEARGFTPGGRGFDLVVDIGGDQTMPQSLEAVRVDGTVATVGQVGGVGEAVPLSAAFVRTCTVRGVLAGSRAQLRELVRFVDEKGIEPAVDDVVFELAEAKEAYRRLKERRHFAKVVLRID